MTRRDLKKEIKEDKIGFCVFVLWMLWIIVFSVLASLSYAQEPAELSDVATGGIYIETTEDSASGEDELKVWFDFDDANIRISGNLRQAIIDTVKAVLKRELQQGESGVYDYGASWGQISDDTLIILGKPIKVVGELDPDVAYIPVRFTNGIPICPYCRVGTVRVPVQDSGNITIYTYYDERGQVIHDKSYTGQWRCNRCDRYYEVIGNAIDGWRYGE